jgi:tetratricopeptide (TPR) repeat protein
MKSLKIVLRALAVVPVAAAILIGAEGMKGKSLNERATAAAWVALDGEKFEAAIKSADECIGEFRGAAKRAQEKLEKERAVIPAKPTTEEQKQKIFENGLLNDVATCYFIKGRAAEKLGRKEDAKKAYEEARKLTYARTWDAQGWFWSPAESAADRLDALR